MPKEEKTYDLPCYVCTVVFKCSKWDITTVVEPAQPLCKKCREGFALDGKVLGSLAKFYGSGSPYSIPFHNKPLKAFIEGLEEGRITPKYMSWFPQHYRAWIQYPEKLKDAHPGRCLCGVCEHDKRQLAKPPSKELQALCDMVDDAVRRCFLGGDEDEHALSEAARGAA
jgi:hypothetical protein